MARFTAASSAIRAPAAAYNLPALVARPLELLQPPLGPPALLPALIARPLALLQTSFTSSNTSFVGVGVLHHKYTSSVGVGSFLEMSQAFFVM